MPTAESLVAVEWVRSEASAELLAAQIARDGGKVLGTTPFVPAPNEADLYSDAGFEPFLVVGSLLAGTVALRYIRELIRDLKGREVAVLDLAGKTPQVRIVPIGAASQVVVKAPDGSVATFSASSIPDIEKLLEPLLSAQKPKS